MCLVGGLRGLSVLSRCTSYRARSTGYGVWWMPWLYTKYNMYERFDSLTVDGINIFSSVMSKHWCLYGAYVSLLAWLTGYTVLLMHVVYIANSPFATYPRTLHMDTNYALHNTTDANNNGGRSKRSRQLTDIRVCMWFLGRCSPGGVRYILVFN